MPQRRAILGWLTSMGVVLVGLYAAEYLLRWRQHSIASSDHLEPGMVRPDPQLGWSLTPHWKGRHQHHDFEVKYSINRNGFRGEDVRSHPASHRRIAVVGDSFTFGLGANDSEVFLHLLNQTSSRRRYYNFSIPGYSTDQELLLIEREVLATKPEELWLVVYVANDLFDNQLPAPLQVSGAKPFYVWTNGSLTLSNAHMPLTGPSPQSRLTLRDMVIGSRSSPSTFREKLEARSELARFLAERLLTPPKLTDQFDRQYDYALQLFWALVGRIQDGCRQAGASFVLVIMAGKSFVEQPQSVSGQYQEYFRTRIMAEARRRNIKTLDIAGELQSSYRAQPGRWFHPHEGHLNAAGHRQVATIIGKSIPADSN